MGHITKTPWAWWQCRWPEKESQMMATAPSTWEKSRPAFNAFIAILLNNTVFTSAAKSQSHSGRACIENPRWRHVYGHISRARRVYGDVTLALTLLSLIQHVYWTWMGTLSVFSQPKSGWLKCVVFFFLFSLLCVFFFKKIYCCCCFVRVFSSALRSFDSINNYVCDACAHFSALM